MRLDRIRDLAFNQGQSKNYIALTGGTRSEEVHDTTTTARIVRNIKKFRKFQDSWSLVTVLVRDITSNRDDYCGEDGIWSINVGSEITSISIFVTAPNSKPYFLFKYLLKYGSKAKISMALLLRYFINIL